MQIRLPQVVPDTPTGGWVMNAMNNVNALTKSNIENQYLPLTTRAEAASKLAYANLMGPQFLAKLMGNDSVAANLSEDQKTEAINKLYGAGSGQGTGAALMGGVSGNNNALLAVPQNNGALGNIINAITKHFNGAFTPSNQSQNNNGNALSASANTGNNPPASSANNNYAYNADGTNQTATPQEVQAKADNATAMPSGQKTDVNAVTGTDENSEIGKATTAWMASPEAAAQAAKQGMYTIPDTPQLLDWYRSKQGQTGTVAANATSAADANAPTAPIAGSTPTYAEKAAAFKGKLAEGEQLGRQRATDIGSLNDQVFNAETGLTTLHDIKDVVSSPEFEQIRQTPLAGHNELAYYAKEGTPAQQQMVGKYLTLTGNLVKDASRDFAGTFRKGEQQLLEGMKPNPGDTVDVAKGKTEQLTYLLQMLHDRTKMTSELMEKYDINKGQANDIADQRINGQKIREQIHDSLNPKVIIKNKKTGETRTVSGSDARKLGAANV